MNKALMSMAMLSVSAMAQQSATPAIVHALPEVHRIYVAELTGDQAAALRDLIISGLDSTKLFVITDNPDRADAILKGAADDHTFDQTLDIQEGISTRENGGKSTGGYKTGGTFAGLSISDTQYHHSKDRKHESYAAVRLVNRDGDVLWSTTQESQGAKFRGASADVAAKVAHQLTLDFDRARHPAATPDTGGSGR
jgi:hypothetical protein